MFWFNFILGHALTPSNSVNHVSDAGKTDITLIGVEPVVLTWISFPSQKVTLPTNAVPVSFITGIDDVSLWFLWVRQPTGSRYTVVVEGLFITNPRIEK